MAIEADYLVPQVTSRFPYRRHPSHDEILQNNQQYYDRFIRPAIKNEYDERHGEYVACGATYAATIYPTGQLELLKPVANSHSAITLLDDVLDNSVNTSFIREFVDMYRQALQGEPVQDSRFTAITELFARPDWDQRAVAMVRASMNAYLDATIKLRTVEIQQRPISIEEYFDIRAFNSIMQPMLFGVVYVNPELLEPYLELGNHPAFQNALRYCGISTGIMLDLANINSPHREICRYSNAARIIARASQDTLDWPRAVGATIDYFHEYEDQMARALDELRVIHPAVSAAMTDVQGGSMSFLGMLRTVGRYGQAAARDT